VIAQVKEKVGK